MYTITETHTHTNTPAKCNITGVANVINEFARVQDIADSSRNLYRRAVSLFFVWVEKTGRHTDRLTAADIITYKSDLLNGGLSSLTVGGYINALRRFYEWAEANKLYPNIAASVHAPKRVKEFRKLPLSVAKVHELLEVEKDKSPRDNAIVNLMIRTGLRCIEVARADIGDIKFIGCENTRVLFIRGKGRDEKDDFVILTDETYKFIADYIATRPNAKDGDPLFVSESNHTADNGRLSTRTISSIAKSGLQNIGLNSKEFTAHSLRHTAGSNVLRAGGSLEQAQMMLRHASPATTEIYARMALKERRFTSGGELLLNKIYQFN